MVTPVGSEPAAKALYVRIVPCQPIILHFRNLPIKIGSMKNAKVENDIKFIDPKTGEVVCTWNQCKDKFKPGYTEKRTLITKVFVKEGTPVEFDFHAHRCDECG